MDLEAIARESVPQKPNYLDNYTFPSKRDVLYIPVQLQPPVETSFRLRNIFKEVPRYADRNKIRSSARSDSLADPRNCQIQARLRLIWIVYSAVTSWGNKCAGIERKGQEGRKESSSGMR